MPLPKLSTKCRCGHPIWSHRNFAIPNWLAEFMFRQHPCTAKNERTNKRCWCNEYLHPVMPYTEYGLLLAQRGKG
jgi:hypothetical protein